MRHSRFSLWMVGAALLFVPAVSRAESQVAFTAPAAGDCVRGGTTYLAKWATAVPGATISYTATNAPSNASPTASDSSGLTASWSAPGVSTTADAYLWLYNASQTQVGSVHFYLDSAAPSAPALSDPPTAKDQNYVSLNWNQSSGCTSGYKIYRDGSLIATVSATTSGYQDTGLIAGTTYVYQVDAYDSAGLVPSNTVKVTTLVAATPTPTATPTATPSPSPTQSAAPVTPTPTVSATPVTPTPTASFDTGSGSALLPSPSPTPVITPAPAVTESSSSRILRYLVGTGALLLLVGLGLLAFWKRKTGTSAPVSTGRKTLTPEVEPEKAENDGPASDKE